MLPTACLFLTGCQAIRGQVAAGGRGRRGLPWAAIAGSLAEAPCRVKLAVSAGSDVCQGLSLRSGSGFVLHLFTFHVGRHQSSISQHLTFRGTGIGERRSLMLSD